jgi:hypothetical protein
MCNDKELVKFDEWPFIEKTVITDQYNETNVMHFSFNL